MPLTPPQAEHVASLLRNVELARRSPAFLRDLTEFLTAYTCQQGQTIYDVGSPAEALFLVGDGRVIQTFGASGQPWFQKELNPGDFFGQQALFSAQHQTKVVAVTPAIVYRMSAAELRALLDRYPDFQEFLLREKRAGRLRSIPLFESLADADIRWLALIVDVEPLKGGEEVAQPQKPGLRVIDWGQIEVDGPAALNRPHWRLTSGNFFFSVQSGLRFGGMCAADTAVAARDSSLFYLPEQHFYRLVAAFPQVRAGVSAPFDPAAALARVPLFSQGMTDAQRFHLAQHCAWRFIPAKQNIWSQGEPGYSFVMLLAGGALISAVDGLGRARPRNLVQPGSAFGTTSLLKSKTHDATVRAVEGPIPRSQVILGGAEILNLDRRDLEVAFKERPDLWRDDVPLYHEFVRIKEATPRYPWQEPGEVVVWSGRSHPFWLAAPLAMVVTFFVLVIALLLTLDFSLPLLSSSTQSALQLAVTLVVALGFLPTVIYVISNYVDDYYVVTNRRVTRRDRELFIRETRTDAPLDMIQDVTYDTILIGRIFNFGNVMARTASKGGGIKFENVPDPELVKEYILREKAEAAAELRGRNREVMRKELIDGLHLAVVVPDVDKMRALGAKAQPIVEPRWWERAWRQLRPPPKSRMLVLPGTPRRTLLRAMTAPLPDRLKHILVGPPPPPPKPLTGEVIWHKHWINLIQRGTEAFVAAIALVLLGTALFVFQSLLAAFFVPLLLVWLLLAVTCASWLAWIYVDYRNDIYVVTDEKIIDIEKKPLALSMKRRESSLRNIQSVFAEQNGVLANLLNFGNVNIRTAAADEGFTFDTITAPKVVQQTIFQKLNAFRQGERQRELKERQQSVLEGLEEYHDLSGESPQGWR